VPDTRNRADLEPLRKNMILLTFKSRSCNTYEEFFGDFRKSFIFSDGITNEYIANSFVSHTYARGTS
jgi:hypothetical protein